MYEPVLATATCGVPDDFVGPVAYRVCKACEEEKPLHLFVSNKAGKMRRTTMCKACDAERAVQWRLDNLEKSRSSAKECAAKRFARDPVAFKEKRSAYFRDNKAEIRVKKLEYVHKNYTKVSTYLREWNERNPEKRKQYGQKVTEANRAAKARGTAYNVPIPPELRAEAKRLKKARYIADWQKRNPDKVRKADRKSYEKHIEARRARGRAWGKKARLDPEFRNKAALAAKEWRARNYERHRQTSKSWYLSHKEQAAKAKRAWVDRNWDHVKEKSRVYCERTKERRSLNQAIWRSKNKDRIADHRFARRGRKPSWVTWQDLYRIKKEARRISKETGILHEIDHVLPLISKHVSGLDVPENLRIIPRRSNRSKGNKISSLSLHEMGTIPAKEIYTEVSHHA